MLHSRRSMLRGAAVAAALPLFSGRLSAAAPLAGAGGLDRFSGLKVGVATYSIRKLKLDDAIIAIRRLGLSYASIKDFHLPLKSTPEQRRDVAGKFKAAGITPLSCGVITMTSPAAARQAFEYARDAGIPTIVCNPEPSVIPSLDALVKEFGIRLAIHNHGPEAKHFKGPDEVWQAIEKSDPRIGFCIDAGHTIRMKVDPAQAIFKYRERLYDVHVRDMDGDLPKSQCIEGGRGIMNLKEILQTLVRIKYQHLVGIEYEKDADDPLPGMAETVGYMAGLLH